MKTLALGVFIIQTHYKNTSTADSSKKIGPAKHIFLHELVCFLGMENSPIPFSFPFQLYSRKLRAITYAPSYVVISFSQNLIFFSSLSIVLSSCLWVALIFIVCCQKCFLEVIKTMSPMWHTLLLQNGFCVIYSFKSFFFFFLA